MGLISNDSYNITKKGAGITSVQDEALLASIFHLLIKSFQHQEHHHMLEEVTDYQDVEMVEQYL